MQIHLGTCTLAPRRHQGFAVTFAPHAEVYRVDFSMSAELPTAHDLEVAGATFGPAAMKAIGSAFEQACADIAGLTGRDSEQTQIMRLKLAKAVLDVATHNSRDVIALKNAALQKLATDIGRHEP